MSKILIVEDDNDINNMINQVLTKEGFETVSAFSGTEAILRLEQEDYDLIILDLMLPGIEGQEVLKKKDKKNVPFIVISAKDEIDTKVELLELGANDYITKPFEIKELIARVWVQIRNTNTRNLTGDLESALPDLTYQELRLNVSGKTLEVNGHAITLTAQEYRIVELFLRNPGKVFSKNEIYEYAWDDFYMGEDKTIYVHISNIRHKIKKYTDTEYIETVWGLGFKL